MDVSDDGTWSDTESDTGSDADGSVNADVASSSFAVAALAVHFALHLRVLVKARERDASRYFHVHPELVDERVEGGERCSYVRLCSKCSTARLKPLGKPPEHAIAHGRDYGRFRRIDHLEPLSAAERVMLAPARTYGVLAKARAWRLYACLLRLCYRSR